MSHKKLIVIGLVVLVILCVIIGGGQTMVRSQAINRTDRDLALSETASQFGMATPSQGFGARDESANISNGIIAPIPSEPTVDSGKNIIQTSAISMIVANVEQSAQEIEQLSKDHGGFISNSSLNSNQSSKQITSGNIQARIPQDKLNTFIDALKSKAIQVKSISTSSDDVTTQVRDLNAEIENLREQETQLRSFFERTSNITQLLEVERELNRVRTQIDQKQGQLNYYERASALSTVSINLALDEAQLPATPASRFQPQAALNGAVAMLLSMLQSLAYAAIYLAVFSVMWIPLLVCIIIVKKIYDRKRA